MSHFAFVEQAVIARELENLRRARTCIESSDGRQITVDGRRYLNFASNDYLGIGSVTDVSNLRQNRIGASASALVTGYTQEHYALEALLCDTLGYEAALLCNSGFSANVGVIKALFNDPKVSTNSTVFQDKLNHASLLDGSLDSNAKLERFNHNDVNHLRSRLEKSKSENKLIVTEGIFSMDGDCAQLDAIADLAKKHNAWLMVDDAHAFGVLGKHGLGSVETIRPNILIITFGKAVGGQGACILGSQSFIDYLLQFNREYIYSTAMSPILAALNLKQVERVLNASAQREKLQSNIEYFTRCATELALPLLSSKSPIQPIVLGDAEATVCAQKKLREKGIWLTAIRPPTVPFNTARLRITITSEHTREDIDTLLMELKQIV
ncbi:8-amino-7-oxononanoate synthase [Pseudoalteromonas xiamenensis]|uniref:aminotransferase class I/II-fold pyridoxal phosphate-dependent enzyme n=1 Tax=Pseudoalteromonas xiamenensis TaxID=882626 RepID=UPI0027E3CF75|nr:8-amino-7-oxononanoate synthase [Pseudoalteromonas xiamenensis]WMN60080.1 8-amino-7-oxononanoate synthase [Pseudoalteromonas xiamenensis]